MAIAAATGRALVVCTAAWQSSERFGHTYNWPCTGMFQAAKEASGPFTEYVHDALMGGYDRRTGQ